MRGYKTVGGGGASKVLPLPKKGGGRTKSFEVVLTWELEVLVIVMGEGHKKFPTFKKKRGGGGFALS